MNLRHFGRKGGSAFKIIDLGRCFIDVLKTRMIY